MLWAVAWVEAARGATMAELPAQLAGLRTWDERLAAVGAVQAADAGEQERLAVALEVVRTLAEREPGAGRARLRDLAAAALSRDANTREEALKSARRGVPLPEMTDDPWFARIPLEPVDGQGPLAVASPRLDGAGWGAAAEDVGRALAEGLAEAGWPVGEGGGSLQAAVEAPPYPARWGDRVGYGVDVAWTIERAGAAPLSATTRAFAPGPIAADSPAQLLAIALDNLLANRGFHELLSGGAAAEVTDPAIARVETGKVCWYRLAHNDPTVLPVFVGGLAQQAPIASYACAELPAGMEVAASEGGGEVAVAAGETRVVRVDYAPGTKNHSMFAPSDAATLDKLVGRKKVAEVPMVRGSGG